MSPKTTQQRNTLTRPKQNNETIHLTKQGRLRALTEDDPLKKLRQTLPHALSSLRLTLDRGYRAGNIGRSRSATPPATARLVQRRHPCQYRLGIKKPRAVSGAGL